MALTYKLTGDVLEVTETLIGWNSTKVTFWYYDVANWLVSNGRPNEAPTRPMTPDAIAWVQKYYIPKVKGV
jgi:hypothetical protein